MFPSSYFAPRMFAPRYWPKTGGVAAALGAAPVGQTWRSPVRLAWQPSRETGWKAPRRVAWKVTTP